MQVTINPLQAVSGGALGLLPAGSTQDLPEALARELVGVGAARWVSEQPPAGGDATKILTAQQVAAVGALVSGTGKSVSSAYVGGASPWVRVFGPNEFRQAPWTQSVELTTPTTAWSYTTAASPGNGACMYQREGASIRIDGSKVLGNTGAPNYGNLRTFASGLTAGALANKTIALLVWLHRPGPTANVVLRVGSSGANYVTYAWGASSGCLQEGPNMLLAHTAEPIGPAGSVPNGQWSFQSAGTVQNGWLVGAGAFDFSQAPAYIAIEVGGVVQNSFYWIEGMYAGGKDEPRLTLGFDIQGSGLETAKAIMDKYGLLGYAAVPTANGVPANPQFLWAAPDVARLQSLQAAGWDLLPHSVAHMSLGTLSDDATILAEITACQRQLQLLGAGESVDLFPTPNGSASNRVVAIAAEAGVRWLRTWLAPVLIPVGLVGQVNPLAQASFSLANQNDTARTFAFFDLLEMYGASGHIFTHAIVAGPSDSLNTNAVVFEAICAEMARRRDLGRLTPVLPTSFCRLGAPRNIKAVTQPPSRVPLVVGASPAELINAAYEPVQMIVTGGTVSAIDHSRDGLSYAGTGETAGVFLVNPGDRLRIAHTGAPSVEQLSV